MQVSKWGNSLPIRLPAAVVEALGLKEIAAAIESSCTVVYSEGLQSGQKIRSLTIRHPFIA